MRWLDRWFGRGEFSLTFPIMDGPMKANGALDAAPALLEVEDLDNLIRQADKTYYSNGSDLCCLNVSDHVATSVLVRSFDAKIGCLAVSPEGGLAVGLFGRGLTILGGKWDGKTIVSGQSIQLNCPTAATFLDEDRLVVTNGSREVDNAGWRRDLMALGRSGSVWLIDLKAGSQQLLADRLGWPAGVAVAGGGRVYVSEAHRHRILSVSISRRAPVEAVLADLPAYPARLIASSAGGYWLTFFANRNSLVEFVLTEDSFRREMIVEVPEHAWIAPALAVGNSMDEPIQESRVKSLGVVKPWAANFAYGLVAYCGPEMRPLASFHSRADGLAHGITSVAELGGDLLIGSRGQGAILRLPEVKFNPFWKAAS